MAKDVRPIYVKDILNLYDYNRDGEKPIYLVEDDGRLIIYLHDNAICEYWAKYKHRADKKIGDDE